MSTTSAGTSIMDRQAYRLREVAELLGVNVKTIRRLIDQGQLPVIRLGRAKEGARRPCLLRVPRAAVESLLQGRVLPPGGSDGGEA